MAGLTAFREAYLTADMTSADTFTDFDGRRMRYDFYWALYQNSAYRNMHTWSNSYRATFGLYRYIRNIYNPAFRLSEFWKAHIMGGALDKQAGDGQTKPSALPIITDNESLRPAIANLWKWSNWQISKDVLSLWGAVLGDAAIKIVDDPERKKVYMKLVNPGTLKSITLDPFGNIKGYTIEEERDDPKGSARKVTYTEIASRDGDDVFYQTQLNGSPYAWDGVGSDWWEPYGFVPMVVIQHNNVGMEWGWSEMHPVLSKFREVDDLSSKLSDQIRKMVDVGWLFTGVAAPKTTQKTTGETPTTDRPEPGREEVPTLYGPVGADAKPLVAPLDIAATSAYITEIIKDIERDYPELNDDVVMASGDISGRALRTSREAIEVKVQQRRANYDDALVRAQQMGVAIGGYRQYQGFTGFGLDSYAAGALDHEIGEREVFSIDPMDDLEYEQLFWKVASEAKTAGMPINFWLKRKQWSDEDIAELIDSPEYQARLASLEQLAMLGNNQPEQDETQDDAATTEE